MKKVDKICSKYVPAYRVVNFFSEKTQDGKSVIDIVPSSWVRLTSDDDGMCMYPPYPFLNVNNMSKNLSPPGLTWREFPVRVTGKADSYKEGIGKVAKAKVTLSASTQEDIPSTPKNVNIKAKCLEDVPLFPPREENHDSQNNELENDGNSPGENSPGGNSPDKRPLDASSPISSLYEPSGASSLQHLRDQPGSSIEETPCISKVTTVSSDRTDKRTGKGRNSVKDKKSVIKEKNKSATKEKNKTAAKETNNRSNTKDRTYAKDKRSVIKEKDNTAAKETENTAAKATKETAAKESGETAAKETEETAAKETEKTAARMKHVVARCLFTDGESPSPVEKSSDFDIKAYLIGMENRIYQKIDRARRSNTHDIKRAMHEIQEVRVIVEKSGIGVAAGEVTDFKLKWFLPFKTLEDFEVFVGALESKEEFGLLTKILRSYWISAQKNTLHKSMHIIIERFLAKEVALLYSSQGKGRLKKSNFSATKFYSALEGMIIDLQPDIDTKEIKSSLGKVLAGVGDWDGGRQDRERQKGNAADTPDQQ